MARMSAGYPILPARTVLLLLGVSLPMSTSCRDLTAPDSPTRTRVMVAGEVLQYTGVGTGRPVPGVSVRVWKEPTFLAAGGVVGSAVSDPEGRFEISLSIEEGWTCSRFSVGVVDLMASYFVYPTRPTLCGAPSSIRLVLKPSCMSQYVPGPCPASIELSPDPVIVESVGHERQVTITARDARNNLLQGSALLPLPLRWSIADTTIASVTEDGRVVGRATGVTTLAVALWSKQTSVRVRVE